MKTLIATLLLVTSSGAAALPHHRTCDRAQERPAQYIEKFQRAHPEERGGNAVRLGRCTKPPAAATPVTLSSWWVAASCGYLAHREGKPLDAVPYPAGHDYRRAWRIGWEAAQRSCASGEIPEFTLD